MSYQVIFLGYRSLIWSYTEDLLEVLEHLVDELGDVEDEVMLNQVNHLVDMARVNASVPVFSLRA
jgi:hypothetical protein